MNVGKLSDRALGEELRRCWAEASAEPTTAKIFAYQVAQKEAINRLNEYATDLGLKVDEVSNLTVTSLES